MHVQKFQQTDLSKGLSVVTRLAKWKVYKAQYSNLSAVQRSLLWTDDCKRDAAAKAMPKGKGEGKGKKEGGRSGGGDDDAAPAAKNGGKGKKEGLHGPDKTKRYRHQKSMRVPVRATLLPQLSTCCARAPHARSMTQTKKRGDPFVFDGSDDESDSSRQTRSSSRAKVRP